MNISSLLTTQMSSNKVNEQKKAVKKTGRPENVKHNSAHKKVAEEMESLFAYQLIKTMRETANSLTAEKKDRGHDTYMSMFDMEISKLFAKRGMGLQDSIINWLDRMPVSRNNNDTSLKND